MSVVSGAPLQRLLKHDLRLDLLCCLLDGPLTALELSARVAKPTTAVEYHLNLLEASNVVEKKNGEEGDETLYAATLDKHPTWVAEAVRNHRRPS